MVLKISVLRSGFAARSAERLCLSEQLDWMFGLRPNRPGRSPEQIKHRLDKAEPYRTSLRHSRKGRRIDYSKTIIAERMSSVPYRAKKLLNAA